MLGTFITALIWYSLLQGILNYGGYVLIRLSMPQASVITQLFEMLGWQTSVTMCNLADGRFTLMRGNHGCLQGNCRGSHLILHFHFKEWGHKQKKGMGVNKIMALLIPLGLKTPGCKLEQPQCEASVKIPWELLLSYFSPCTVCGWTALWYLTPITKLSE